MAANKKSPSRKLDREQQERKQMLEELTTLYAHMPKETLIPMLKGTISDLVKLGPIPAGIEARKLVDIIELLAGTVHARGTCNCTAETGVCPYYSLARDIFMIYDYDMDITKALNSYLNGTKTTP